MVLEITDYLTGITQNFTDTDNMILTITFNPLLEKTFFYKKINLTEINRAVSSKISAGGKGINISRQLNLFKTDNLATGFLGGDNGKRLKQILYKENIKNSFISIKSETREGFVTFDKSNLSLYTFFSPNPKIEQSEISELIEKTKKIILNCEMVIISGTYPDDNCLDAVKDLIKFSNNKDKIVLFDINTTAIKEILECKPLIIHLNKDEVESSFGIKLSTGEDKINFLKTIDKDGIRIFLLTDGKEPFYASNHSFIYECFPPSLDCINPTGSGDAFVSGFVYAFHNNLPFEESLKLAIACGSLNANSLEVCQVDFNKALELSHSIIVKKILL